MQSSKSLYDQILGDLTALPEKDRATVIRDVTNGTKNLAWVPNPGPQTEAFFCEADILLYGGSGGSGKSALLAGLATTEHERSLIVRRHYADLTAMIDEIGDIIGRTGFTGSPRPKYKTDKRLIDFGACANPGDEEHWQGNPHDFLGIDETVQLLENQVRFLLGWVRSKNKRQRSRAVLATNPPVRAEGRWIIGMFRPWLDPTHPKPAQPGELRWFVVDPDGKDMEVADNTPIEMTDSKGEVSLYIPQSRTFIPGKLADNPFLANTNYKATLDGMKGVLRDAVRDGNFMAQAADGEWQVIPSDWVRAAQRRWNEAQGCLPEGVPMCAIACDVAQGGNDDTVIATRYDGFFPPLVAVPGKLTPGGRDVAALVIKHRREPAEIIVDMGGGYGGAALEHLQDNGFEVYGYKGVNSANKRTRDGRLGFYNMRSQAFWLFREALDPEQPGGSPIMLPDDQMLVADLTAPEYEIGPNGIMVEQKEQVVKRLGRSTDRGDSVIMCWARGQRALHDKYAWEQGLHGGRRLPQVVMGRPAQRAQQAQQQRRVITGREHGGGWGGRR